MNTDWTSALRRESQAQDTFLRLLQQAPRDAFDEFQGIRQHLVEERLLFGEHPIPLIFPPLTLDRARWNSLTDSLDKLHSILTKIEPLLHEKKWLDWLGFREDEQDWIRLAGQVSPGQTISRVDGFLGESPQDADQYQIVELNIDSPGGGAFLDVSSEIVEASPLWKEFAKQEPGCTIPFGPALYDHLENVWTDFLKSNPQVGSASGKPRIAIVDWITVSTHREFELIAKGLEERGFSVLIADPRELQYSLGRLRCYDGKPIDMVYRRVLVEDMLRDPGGSRSLVEACRDQNLCMVNSFSSKPLTVKSLLALFHSELADELLSPEEIATVKKLVPLTLRLEEANLAQILAEQDQLVLKPADGWGAQGLYLGWRCTKAEWGEHVRRSLAIGAYVAQRRVPIPQRSLPTWTGENWECFRYLFDLSPYSLAERSVSPLVRLSPSEVLNVKQGAQISAVWILDEPSPT